MMYKEEREILLLQREKYKLKIIETFLETKEKVVSKKGLLAIGGTVLLGFLAYKGVNWFSAKNAKKSSSKELAESNTSYSNSWTDMLKEQAVIALLDIGKEQLQKLFAKGK
jgi:hypothetical protein